MKEYEVKYSESVEKTIKVKAEDEYTAKKVATKKYFEGLREDEVDVFVNGMSIDVLGEVGNHTIDPMYDFAIVYGEYSEWYGTYKWQKLTTAAHYYGYEFNAHDSLEDIKATKFVYEKLQEESL